MPPTLQPLLSDGHGRQAILVSRFPRRLAGTRAIDKLGEEG